MGKIGKITGLPDGRAERTELARRLSEELRIDVGIAEHSLRSLRLDPFRRLALGLKMGGAPRREVAP